MNTARRRLQPQGIRTQSPLPVLVLCAFLLFVLLFGGASRSDALSQVVVRGGAVAFACAGLLLLRRDALTSIRAPALFLLAFAVVIALQLVPLPPGLWASLPGRDFIAQGAPLAGIEQPWRPLSLTPDLTINSLLALLPAAALLILAANTDPRDARVILWLLVAMIVLTGIVGLIQLTTQASWLFPYRITNTGEAVGLFANRNHQAVFLVTIFPILATTFVVETSRHEFNKTVPVILMAIALFLVPLILATGSRAGLALTIVGVLGAALIVWRRNAERRTSKRTIRFKGRRSGIWLASGAIAALLVAVTIYYSRGAAIIRLYELDVAGDKRIQAFSTMVDMAWAYFPTGSGFGSFADIFRIHEPMDLLGLTYMNHAHIDLLEVVIEGGLAAVLLLSAALVWYLRATYRVWTESGRGREAARLGSILLPMIALASLVDYPIRTPTFSVLVALSAFWLARGAFHGAPQAEVPGVSAAVAPAQGD
jgi:hypothetical protein